MATEHELREYLRKATAVLQETKQRLQEEQEKNRQPIAIVAMACRLPERIETPEAFWDLLASGKDALSMPPPHRRWDVGAILHADPDEAGKAYSLRGGFLHDADAFDAAFFELSAREATLMDPQQRLLLEVCWEVLERAGIPAAAFQGSRTAVFAGVMENAYSAHLLATPAAHDRNVSLGSRASVASARIAYALGLTGAAVSIDTACSSSLVAIHLACQALRLGECDLALAGGATVLATPTLFLESSRQRSLAPDGRCKPFADAADGIGWAEGVGVLALERLADARRNGHPILALVRGSAVNSDGRGQGFTAPSSVAQQALVRDALRASGVDPAEVDVVEAHGTGTSVGDTIEAQAILETYGAAHSAARPLWLGNAKPAVGHAQAASGVVGIIKTVLAMQRGLMPGMGAFGAPNRHVDWSTGAVRLLDAPTPWERASHPHPHPRRAGVSAFGVGTNAHVILEEAPAESANVNPAPEAEHESVQAVPLLLSAKTEGALAACAAQLADHLERTSDALASVAWTLARHRTHFRFRAGLVARDRAAAIAALRTLARGVTADDTVQGVAGEETRATFVIPDGDLQPPATRTELLRSAIAHHVRGVAVDWAAVLGSGRLVALPTYPFQRDRYWLEAAAPDTTAASTNRHIATPESGATAPLRAALTELPEAEHGTYLLALVREQIAEVLALPGGHAVDVERPLFHMGCDSLRATDLRNRLRALTGAALPATLVFEHPTAEAIVAVLHRTLRLHGALRPQGTASDAARGPASAAPRVYEEFDL